MISLVLQKVRSVRHRVAIRFGLRPNGREHILRRAPKGAVCAEIGVFRGEFASHIVRITRPAEMHLIDGWWALYGERYPDWGAYTDYGRLGTRQAHDEAQEAAPNAILHVGHDLEVLASFPDRHFDWAYLDTSHTYGQTVAELAMLSHKIKPGGLLLGDDWHDDATHTHAGVSKAVREACASGEWRTIVEGDEFAQWAIRLVRPHSHHDHSKQSVRSGPSKLTQYQQHAAAVSGSRRIGDVRSFDRARHNSDSDA